MRALVTGASGFAGRHLVRHLLAQGDDVLATCLQTTFTPGDINAPDFNIARLDVTNFEDCKQVLGNVGPEVIYHLAAIAFVPDAERDFGRALMVNVGGTHNVYRAAVELKLDCRIVLVSSAEVYGRIQPEDLPISEELKPRPAHNYSLSKEMTERIAERYHQHQNISSVIIRPFNHVGPGQKTDFVVPSFAFQLARIAKQKADKIIKVGNLEAKRDFTDVRDIVRGYRLAALKAGRNEIYNLCSGRAVRIRSILDELIAISGLDVAIEQDPTRMRPAEVPEIYGSYAKAQAELGWKPEYPLKASLTEVYKYCLTLA